MEFAPSSGGSEVRIIVLARYDAVAALTIYSGSAPNVKTAPIQADGRGASVLKYLV